MDNKPLLITQKDMKQSMSPGEGRKEKVLFCEGFFCFGLGGRKLEGKGFAL